jgi:hypothetical protein
MDFNQIRELVKRHSEISEQKKWIEFQLELPWKLLELLEDAQMVGVSTAFYRNEKDDALVVKFYGIREYKDLVFKFEVDNKLYYMIEQLENIRSYIDSIQEEIEEGKRINELQKSAMSKLTYEEQVALGLVTK